MVLISIRPFGLRKLFLIFAALVCFSVMCFADPVLMAQRYVPAAGPLETEIGSDLNQKPRPTDLLDVVDPLEHSAVRSLDLPLRDQRLLPGFGQIIGQLPQCESTGSRRQAV